MLKILKYFGVINIIILFYSIHSLYSVQIHANLLQNQIITNTKITASSNLNLISPHKAKFENFQITANALNQNRIILKKEKNIVNVKNHPILVKNAASKIIFNQYDSITNNQLLIQELLRNKFHFQINESNWELVANKNLPYDEKVYKDSSENFYKINFTNIFYNLKFKNAITLQKFKYHSESITHYNKKLPIFVYVKRLFPYGWKNHINELNKNHVLSFLQNTLRTITYQSLNHKELSNQIFNDLNHILIRPSGTYKDIKFT